MTRVARKSTGRGAGGRRPAVGVGLPACRVAPRERSRRSASPQAAPGCASWLAAASRTKPFCEVLCEFRRRVSDVCRAVHRGPNHFEILNTVSARAGCGRLLPTWRNPDEVPFSREKARHPPCSVGDLNVSSAVRRLPTHRVLGLAPEREVADSIGRGDHVMVKRPLRRLGFVVVMAGALHLVSRVRAGR